MTNNSINTWPKVSVVMSLYNSREYLKEAIDSVLCQTLSDFEFIIIDDGSIDDSVDIVRSYGDTRIHLVPQDNAGLAAALNRGIQLAKSNFIARMDPDDICFPERLLKQYEYLQQHPEIMVVGSAAMCIDESGEKLPVVTMQANFDVGELAVPESPCIHPSVMFRRSAFEKAGGYWDKMRFGGEDAILFNSILAFGKIVNLSEVLMYYRLSSSSMSQKSRKFNILLRRMVCKKVQGNLINDDEWRDLAQEYRLSKSGGFPYHMYIAKLFLGMKGYEASAREHFFKALQVSPLSWRAWLYLVSSYIPFRWRVSLRFYLK